MDGDLAALGTAVRRGPAITHVASRGAAAPPPEGDSIEPLDRKALSVGLLAARISLRAYSRVRVSLGRSGDCPS